MSNESDYPAKYQLEDGSGFYLLETGTDYLIKELQDYAELVRTDGAICYFRFGEASGNFTDIIGSRTGTPTGSITYSQTGALVGDPDTAIGLSSADSQFITVTGEAALTAPAYSNNLTIEAWVSMANNAVADRGFIARFLDSGNHTYWNIRLDVTSATTITIVFSATATAGTLFVASRAVTAIVNPFHHVVAVFDGTNAVATLYFDGSQAGITEPWSGTPIVYTNGDLKIGSNAGVDTIKGRLDEYAIYPTALTADQIARHYRCGLQFLPNETGFATPSQYAQLLAH